MILYSLPVAAVAIICIFYVDRPLSLFVQSHLYGNKVWSDITSTIPDALLATVIIISTLSCTAYLSRKYKHVYDTRTFLLKVVAISLPVSYVVKTALKVVFGRIETRIWLQNSQQYGFHWFHGGFRFDGFPSGHMVVFATLFSAIWRIYPKYKIALVLLLAVLGVLLLATNYHFLSDVICGTYLGLLVESIMQRYCSAERNSPLH